MTTLDPDHPNAYSSFSGRVAVITGGTQGLGLATAELMAARGADGLVIVGRDSQKGSAAAAALQDEDCRVVFVSADLATESGAEQVIAAVDAEFGVVDAFVNCAALTSRGTVWNTTGTMWDEMLALNVRMPGLLVTGLAKIMKREGVAGSMVLVSSIAHHGGNEVLWPYSTSKHALETMVRSAAYALMPEHIRVNMVSPGWMDTPNEDLIQKRFHDAPDDWLMYAEAAQPFGRLLKPAEVARTLCFLASDESGMMTGASLDLDQTIPTMGHRARPEPVPMHYDWEDT
jgi:NAD(P)-dependent dehydrogenase (short-subunit alcohol dehydrogenase family)